MDLTSPKVSLNLIFFVGTLDNLQFIMDAAAMKIPIGNIKTVSHHHNHLFKFVFYYKVMWRFEYAVQFAQALEYSRCLSDYNGNIALMEQTNELPMDDALDLKQMHLRMFLVIYYFLILL
jgi:hypothetical protein